MMQNWNKLWDPKALLNMLLSHYLNKTTAMYFSLSILGLLLIWLINKCTKGSVHCKPKAGLRFISYVEHLNTVKEVQDQLDNIYTKYLDLVKASDVDMLHERIAKLERDVRALTRENNKLRSNEESDTEDEDYVPLHKLYHTASGTKLHSDEACQYIANSSITELDVDDELYNFLTRVGVLCKCDT